MDLTAHFLARNDSTCRGVQLNPDTKLKIVVRLDNGSSRIHRFSSIPSPLTVVSLLEALRITPPLRFLRSMQESKASESVCLAANLPKEDLCYVHVTSTEPDVGNLLTSLDTASKNQLDKSLKTQKTSSSVTDVVNKFRLPKKWFSEVVKAHKDAGDIAGRKTGYISPFQLRIVGKRGSYSFNINSDAELQSFICPRDAYSDAWKVPTLYITLNLMDDTTTSLDSDLAPESSNRGEPDSPLFRSDNLQTLLDYGDWTCPDLEAYFSSPLTISEGVLSESAVLESGCNSLSSSLHDLSEIIPATEHAVVGLADVESNALDNVESDNLFPISNLLLQRSFQIRNRFLNMRPHGWYLPFSRRNRDNVARNTSLLTKEARSPKLRLWKHRCKFNCFRGKKQNRKKIRRSCISQKNGCTATFRFKRSSDNFCSAPRKNQLARSRATTERIARQKDSISECSVLSIGQVPSQYSKENASKTQSNDPLFNYNFYCLRNYSKWYVDVYASLHEGARFLLPVTALLLRRSAFVEFMPLYTMVSAGRVFKQNQQIYRRMLSPGFVGTFSAIGERCNQSQAGPKCSVHSTVPSTNGRVLQSQPGNATESSPTQSPNDSKVTYHPQRSSTCSIQYFSPHSQEATCLAEVYASVGATASSWNPCDSLHFRDDTIGVPSSPLYLPTASTFSRASYQNCTETVIPTLYCPSSLKLAVARTVDPSPESLEIRTSSHCEQTARRENQLQQAMDHNGDRAGTALSGNIFPLASLSKMLLSPCVPTRLISNQTNSERNEPLSSYSSYPALSISSSLTSQFMRTSIKCGNGKSNGFMSGEYESRSSNVTYSRSGSGADAEPTFSERARWHSRKTSASSEYDSRFQYNSRGAASSRSTTPSPPSSDTSVSPPTSPRGATGFLGGNSSKSSVFFPLSLHRLLPRRYSGTHLNSGKFTHGVTVHHTSELSANSDEMGLLEDEHLPPWTTSGDFSSNFHIRPPRSHKFASGKKEVDPLRPSYRKDSTPTESPGDTRAVPEVTPSKFINWWRNAKREETSVP